MDPDIWMDISGSGYMNGYIWIRIHEWIYLDPDTWMDISGSGYMNGYIWIRIYEWIYLDPDISGSGYMNGYIWIRIYEWIYLDPDTWMDISGSSDGNYPSTQDVKRIDSNSMKTAPTTCNTICYSNIGCPAVYRSYWYTGIPMNKTSRNIGLPLKTL